MARLPVPPLDWQTPIVDQTTGQPSAQFMRLWQILFQNESGTNAEAVDAASDAAAALAGLAAKADKVRLVIAGNGLTGGGDLSADRTIDINTGTGLTIVTDQLKLADTAVVPGTYGDATHVPQIVVDQQGRLTSVTNVAVTGGGGGTPWWYSAPLASAFTRLSGDATLPTLTDDANVGLILDAGTPVTADKSRIAVMTIPSPTANWSVEAQFDFTLPATNFGGIGMYIRNASTGKLYSFGFDQGTGAIVIQRRPGLTGFTSGAYSQVWTSLSSFKFWKIVYTASTTTYAFYASPNGKQWFLQASYGIADHLGAGNQADQVGFGVCYNYSASIPAGVTCGRWVKSW